MRLSDRCQFGHSLEVPLRIYSLACWQSGRCNLHAGYMLRSNLSLGAGLVVLRVLH